MPKVGGRQPSNQHNKQKSCDLIISYKLLASPTFPPPPLKKFPEIADQFVTPGNIQIGEGYRKNLKISRACFCHSCSFYVSMSLLNMLLGYIENLKP